MSNELQRAGMWKRIAAWMFDGILLSVIVVGIGVLLSWVLGYDGYSAAVDAGYARYEAEYGVTFEISLEEYEAMTEADRTQYDAAYEALIADQEVLYNYNMMTNLTLVIITLAMLAGLLIWEFFMPLWLGYGQTLGKRIFSICLVRNDGVKMNTLQLFARTILGKFAIETMIPVYVLIMLVFGTMDLTGTLILLGLLVAQVLCLALTRNHCAIHDLIAGTVVVDKDSQTIFRTTEDLIAWKKKVAAQRAAREPY